MFVLKWIFLIGLSSNKACSLWPYLPLHQVATLADWALNCKLQAWQGHLVGHGLFLTVLRVERVFWLHHPRCNLDLLNDLIDSNLVSLEALILIGSIAIIWTVDVIWRCSLSFHHFIRKEMIFEPNFVPQTSHHLSTLTMLFFLLFSELIGFRL